MDIYISAMYIMIQETFISRFKEDTKYKAANCDISCASHFSWNLMLSILSPAKYPPEPPYTENHLQEPANRLHATCYGSKSLHILISASFIYFLFTLWLNLNIYLYNGIPNSLKVWKAFCVSKGSGGYFAWLMAAMYPLLGGGNIISVYTIFYCNIFGLLRN